MQDRDRVAIIGAGHVGSTAAYALMLRALFREIVLIDTDGELAEAEAADIADANALARPVRVWAGDYADAARARVAVITAGAATHDDEDRLSVAGRSAAIVGACVSALMEAGFEGILLVASNPVDLMALLAFRQSGLPATRVIGTGTLLDTIRLRQTLGARLNVAAASIEGMVLGEHGNSEVAAFSTVRIGGLPLDRFAPDMVDHDAVADEVAQAAYRIIEGKGSTSFGVATAIVRICEAIMRDERAVLPLSVLIEGAFGMKDVYLSLPCIVGAQGIERVMAPDLADHEVEGLKASAKTLGEAMTKLETR